VNAERANERSASVCVLLAGGGSGGHIFPAVAIAERVREALPEAQCRYIVSERPLDARILSGLGERFDPIPARPPAMRPLAMARFITGWGPAVRAGRSIVQDAKRRSRSVVMAATGGFVSAPAAQAARAEGVPVILVNLDSAPGKASRWIARFAALRLTPEGDAPASWERTGPIVRSAALAPGPPETCRRRLGLAPEAPTLLITGASQGAASINRLIEGMLEATPEVFDGWQVVHQTGDGAAQRVREAHQRAGVPARVEPLFEAMGEAWGAADLALSRAGAGSVGEAWANRVPALFLPYPFHRDEHQRRNAAPLERAGCAIVERDRVDPERNMDSVGRRLTDLLRDGAARSRMREAFASLPPADGASRAASRILRLVREGGGA